MVIGPARNELSDAKLDVAALGEKLDGTRIIAESELSVRRYMVFAQLVGALVMTLFLVSGLLSLLLPVSPDPPSGATELRRIVIPIALIMAEVGDGVLQGALLLATFEMRNSRRKWSQHLRDEDEEE